MNAINSKKKTALVLSGGVIKAAAWHLGVAKGLEEVGFTFEKDSKTSSSISALVGSSAGAFVSSLLASGYSSDSIYKAAVGIQNGPLKPIGYKDIFKLKRSRARKSSSELTMFEGLPFLVKQLLRPVSKVSGFFSTDGLRSYLSAHMKDRINFDQLPVDLFIVATKLDDSNKVVFSRYDNLSIKSGENISYVTGVTIPEACAASMSIPLVFIPYLIKNPSTGQESYYIDGEIRDTLSSHVALDNGADLVISSCTHTPYHFREDIGSLVEYGLPAIALQTIYLMIEQKILNFKTKLRYSNDVISTVDKFLHDNMFPQDKIKELTEILEQKLSFNRATKYIDIYPDPSDFDTFITNHFSFDPIVMERIMRAAHIKTLQAFKEWT